jgi:hypothetical protein
MIKYENYLFMFGGIQDVTKEKNDIIIFQFDKGQWFKIHTTTNAVYDCSPTLKRDSKVPPLRLRRTKVQTTLPARFRLRNRTELTIR